MNVAAKDLVPTSQGSIEAESPELLAPDWAASSQRRVWRATRRRGLLIRRTLVVADLLGLTLAFLATQFALGAAGAPIDQVNPVTEFFAFICTLPVWLVAAKLYGLYDRDEERTNHSTVDEFVGVFHVVSVGIWLIFIVSWATGLADPNLPRLVMFWGLAIAFVTIGRGSARIWCRRRPGYRQNTVIVGAGDVGQLVARKFVQHPEYGINLLGLVDAAPREIREDLGRIELLGRPEELPYIIKSLDVERVVIAFSNDSHQETLALIRSLKDLDVQVDIVPRLFEVVGPSVGMHTVEGLPIVGLPPARISRSSRLVKRTIDVTGALVGLILTSPLFAYAALRIKLDSPGPVFFRQTRLGLDMEDFTVFKFRTMYVDVDDAPHRDYIKSTMASSAAPRTNGLYKLERTDAITPFGRWLRKTSLDELPQLWNVLRGDMSLVGPRPCLAYETEHFETHHFERFLVPPGVTGLWQVTARAHSTFGEALDMDVAYVHGWSIGLDIWLLCKTPFQVFRPKETA